jgi:hypothetical protein
LKIYLELMSSKKPEAFLSLATLNDVFMFFQATCIARNDNPASFDPFSVEVNHSSIGPDLSSINSCSDWLGLKKDIE